MIWEMKDGNFNFNFLFFLLTNQDLTADRLTDNKYIKAACIGRAEK